MAKRVTTRKKTAQAKVKTKTRTKTQKKKPHPSTDQIATFDVRTQRRALQLFNRARTAKELVSLPPNTMVEHGHLGPGEPAIHDEIHHVERVPLFDLKAAEKLLAERDKLSPVYGFRHIDGVVA